MARAFLIEAHMPAPFWVNAIHTTMFVANRLSTPNIQGQSPFEKLLSNPLIITFSKLLVVLVTQISQPPLLKSSLHILLDAFSLDTPPITKVTNVLTPLRVETTLVAMFFMSMNFLCWNFLTLLTPHYSVLHAYLPSV